MLPLLAGLALLPATLAQADYSVGRIVSVQGQTQAQTPGDAGAHTAVANAVLAEGDQLATGGDGSIQLEFAGVSATLGPTSVLILSQVRTDQIVLYLAQGTLAAGRANERATATTVVQGPQVNASLDVAGRYRLDVAADATEERLTVWQGRATVEVDQRDYTLYAGQVLDWSPGSDSPLQLTQATGMDTLDLNTANQVQAWRNLASHPYVGLDWVGAEALDQQGGWQETAGLGPLWVPWYLPAGWAPYGSGYWVWSGVWGWTWVDTLPWAYTTFHFGRWLWWHNRWAWSPQGRDPVFSAAGVVPQGIRPPPLPNTGPRQSILPAGTLLRIASRSGTPAHRPPGAPPHTVNNEGRPGALPAGPAALPGNAPRPDLTGAPGSSRPRVILPPPGGLRLPAASLPLPATGAPVPGSGLPPGALTPLTPPLHIARPAPQPAGPMVPVSPLSPVTPHIGERNPEPAGSPGGERATQHNGQRQTPASRGN